MEGRRRGIENLNVEKKSREYCPASLAITYKRLIKAFTCMKDSWSYWPMSY